MNSTPFSSSLDALQADVLNRLNPLTPFTNEIANEGLFGRKKKRMYFTGLKDVFFENTSLTSATFKVSDLPDVELFIDPQDITVTKKIIVQKRLSKEGWVFQFWGHDLEVISVKSISGYFGMTQGKTLTELRGLIKSEFDFKNSKQFRDPLHIFNKLKDNCYMKRFDDNVPYKGAPFITMVFEGEAYKGFFDNFKYHLGATSPFVINYDFNFVVIPPRTGISFGEIMSSSIVDLGSQIVGGGLRPVANLLTDPAGTIYRASEATISYTQKIVEKAMDKLTKRIGLPDILDLEPSKVTLY